MTIRRPRQSGLPKEDPGLQPRDIYILGAGASYAIETRLPGTAPPRIVVVDKGKPKTSQVRTNYERFFGKRVEYHGDGFDAWLNHSRD